MLFHVLIVSLEPSHVKARVVNRVLSIACNFPLMITRHLCVCVCVCVYACIHVCLHDMCACLVNQRNFHFRGLDFNL